MAERSNSPRPLGEDGARRSSQPALPVDVTIGALHDAMAINESLRREQTTLREKLSASAKNEHLLAQRLETEIVARNRFEREVGHVRDLLEATSVSFSQSERQVSALQSEVFALVGELKMSNSEVEKQQSQIKQLRKENAELIRTNQEISGQLEALARQADAQSTKLHELTQAREAAMQRCSEWESEHAALQRTSDAALQLLKAQLGSTTAQLQSDCDALRNELNVFQSAKESLEEQMALMKEESARRDETHRAVVENLHRSVSQLSSDIQEQRDASTRRQREFDDTVRGLERRVMALTQRSESLSRALEDSRNTCAGLEEEILTGKETNRLLAQRLKAAAADREAAAMEAEARKLLMRQNDEMERQVVELRKTIHALMSARETSRSSTR